jgi:aerobic-type carbon monoxide dehydrogenase small subunit (CoxS/CutS family)
MEQPIRFKLNSGPVGVTSDDERALLWVLRTDFGLPGAKETVQPK